MQRKSVVNTALFLALVPVLAVLLYSTVVVTIVDSSTVLAGGALKGKQLDSQLGLRFTAPLPNRVAAGQSVEAVVVDQAKLAKFGITAKNGDKLKLTVTQENKTFSIPAARGAAVHFNIDQAGIVRKAN